MLVLFAMACSPAPTIDTFKLTELERKGYFVTVDSLPVVLSTTHLNQANILKVKIDRKNRKLFIQRKDKRFSFYSTVDLIRQNNYTGLIDKVVVDGTILDSAMIKDTRFEEGSVRYIRLLTQKDYEGKEFDNLPDIKQLIGNGMLIINTVVIVGTAPEN